MSRSRSTTKQLSYAMKLANEQLPEDCTVLIAYDKGRRSWFASYVNSKLEQIGDLGEGHDPMSAVEHLLELKRLNLIRGVINTHREVLVNLKDR